MSDLTNLIKFKIGDKDFSFKLEEKKKFYLSSTKWLILHR